MTVEENKKHVITACCGSSCSANNSAIIIKDLKAFVEKNKNFELQIEECLGACGMSPAIMLDHDLVGELTQEKVKVLLEKY